MRRRPLDRFGQTPNAAFLRRQIGTEFGGLFLGLFAAFSRLFPTFFQLLLNFDACA